LNIDIKTYRENARGVNLRQLRRKRRNTSKKSKFLSTTEMSFKMRKEKVPSCLDTPEQSEEDLPITLE